MHGAACRHKCETYVFDESTLVLERVALAEMVQLVVQMLVNLATGAVFEQQSPEHSKLAHPHDLPAVGLEDGFDARWSRRPRGVAKHTLAFVHPQYPSSFRNLGVCQSSSQR